MLKHIFKIYCLLLTTVLMLVATSCTDMLETPEIHEQGTPGTVTITFSSSQISRSANSRSTDSDKSEWRIINLVIGLYPLTADENQQAVVWGYVEGLDESGKEPGVSVTLRLNDGQRNTLFPGDERKCRIFALANVSEETKNNIRDYATIAEMKSVAIGSAFNVPSTPVQPSFVMFGGNDEILYTPAASLNERGKATGKVELQRAAARIRLNIKVPERYEVKDEDGNVIETWRPRGASNIRVSLNNGVKAAVAMPVPAGSDENPWKPAADDDYYSSTPRALTNAGTGTFPYVQDVPFYTYPNAWEENMTETHKTTLTLVVPWYRDGESEAQATNYYYQVPVTPSNITYLKSNNSYTVSLTVGMLGSLVPETPLLVEDVSYQIVDWKDADVPVRIEDYRYLVVNPNVLTFNNETQMAVPYYSSHPVQISDVKIIYQRFNYISESSNPDVGKVVTFTIDEDQIKATNEKNPSTPICTTSLSTISGQDYANIFHPLNLWAPFNNDNNEVKLIDHAELSDTTATAESIKYYMPQDDDAFSMYTITFKLSHIDAPEYNESVIIYQYPAIYIVASPNPSSKVSNNVFVNGYSNRSAFSEQYGSPSYGTVAGLSGGLNKNPNMYIINVTSLSENNTFTIIDETNKNKEVSYTYTIGDPRMTEIRNWLTTDYVNPSDTTQGWANLPATPDSRELTNDKCRLRVALYDSKSQESSTMRRLKYYYNTIEDGSVASMLSPQFRIASSWGVTTGIIRPYARYRAALYQENIYPAGRWRVPTLAEFCFINKLSAENKIPTLFTKNVPYWTSEGLYKGMTDGTIRKHSNQGRWSAVRAVYDEWYWNEYPQYSITPVSNNEYNFRLGDLPRGLK